MFFIKRIRVFKKVYISVLLSVFFFYFNYYSQNQLVFYMLFVYQFFLIFNTKDLLFPQKTFTINNEQTFLEGTLNGMDN